DPLAERDVLRLVHRAHTAAPDAPLDAELPRDEPTDERIVAHAPPEARRSIEQRSSLVGSPSLVITPRSMLSPAAILGVPGTDGQASPREAPPAHRLTRTRPPPGYERSPSAAGGDHLAARLAEAPLLPGVGGERLVERGLAEIGPVRLAEEELGVRRL